MDDLEQKLRGLPLRTPSHDLDERILPPVEMITVRRPEAFVRRRVPLWAAVAASLVLAAVGFAGGVLLVAHRPPAGSQVATPPVVRMEVIYTNSPPNPFDYTQTQTPQDFLPEPLKVDVRVNGGV